MTLLHKIGIYAIWAVIIVIIGEVMEEMLHYDTDFIQGWASAMVFFNIFERKTDETPSNERPTPRV